MRKDHDIQRKLVDKLIQTQGDSERRDDLFEQIKTELKSHAAAEERHFYVPLMEYDMTLEKSRHSVTEHHEIDKHLGSVEYIGLKTTRIRSLSGEQLIFSNSDLLKSRIRNYGRMFERRVVFNLGVIYSTPPPG